MRCFAALNMTYNRTMRLADLIFPKAKDFAAFAPPEGALPTKALPFIWVFVRALRWSMVCICICFALNTIGGALAPYFLGRIVDRLVSADRAHLWSALWPIVLAYVLVCHVMAKGTIWFGWRVVIYMRPMLTLIVRRRLASYLFSHSYRFFQDDFAGRLAGKVVEMPSKVTQIVSDTTGTVLQIFVEAVVTLGLFGSMDWRFAVAELVYFAVNAACYRTLIPELERRSEIKSAAQNAMRGTYLDSISNILLVKLFGRERHEDNLFSASMVTASRAEERENSTGTWLWGLQELINAVFQIAILVIATAEYASGRLSAGEVATALTLALTVCMNIYWLLMMATGYFSNIAIVQEALGTIITPAEVLDVPSPAALSSESGNVQCDGITFAYPGQIVFSDFTLDIPQGQRVGLVGPSGAGKSTLVQLVLRLFDVQAGAIRIGGQDIREVAQGDLRRSIAMIPQATDLMHRSIRDNIAYGDLDASEERIVDAAKKAFIHDTILGLRDSHGNTGYDSLVGERGVKLSGGQRQRIAIARAFLKNAPILILDEATSALDSESERLIQQSLDELFKGRTVIAIAHRLSTIAHLDRIVVMENGRIVDDGPHASLVNAGGLYARLWQLQSAGFIGDKV